MYQTDLQHLDEQLRRMAPLSNDDLSLLHEHLQERRLDRGESFVAEGKRATAIGFLLEGDMRQFYTRDGAEKTTYFFFEYHLLGAYLNCISGTASQVTIEALTPCRLLQFPYRVLEQLYDSSPAWERFGRKLAEYIAAGLEERMTGLLMESPEERYGQLLKSGKDKIITRIPQHYIADYLGITPVSLSRIRHRIAERDKK